MHSGWQQVAKEGSRCFLRYKSLFLLGNPLVTQCTVIISSCLSLQHPSYDVLFSRVLAFSPRGELENITRRRESGEEELSSMEKNGDTERHVFMSFSEHFKLAITLLLWQDIFWGSQGGRQDRNVYFWYDVIRTQRKITTDKSELEFVEVEKLSNYTKSNISRERHDVKK